MLSTPIEMATASRRLAAMRRVGADDRGEGRDKQREVGGGKIYDVLPHVMQRAVGETLQVGGGLEREQRDVGGAQADLQSARRARAIEARASSQVS